MSQDYPEHPEIPDTYEILENGRAIRCLHCMQVSHSPDDVEALYCGHCHVFHEDIWPASRKQWIETKAVPTISISFTQPELSAIVFALLTTVVRIERHPDQFGSTTKDLQQQVFDLSARLTREISQRESQTK